jgi:hypothetical protein
VPAWRAHQLNGLARNRRVVIPGAAVRVLMASSRVSPTGLQLRVMDVLVPRGAAKD